IIALIILFLIGLCLTLIVGAITFQLMRMLFGEAPFVSTGKDIRQEIIDTIPLRPESIVYDLGCGDAQVLIACHQREPRAHYIGIEKNIIPYCLARWNLFHYGHPESITLLKRDLFSVDYSQASILYAYLFTGVLDTLLPKLERELRPGTTVVTPTFRFTRKQPSKMIPIIHAQGAKTLIREVSLTTF
ncbi:MAG: hypothetical protein WBO66_04970, partial [Candidatus Moraniibacteriota bacterium]